MKIHFLIIACIFGLIPINAIAQSDGHDTRIDHIRSLYSQFKDISVDAACTNIKRRTITTVKSTGEFSYIQYDHDLYQQIYREHRDADNEWKTIPAHFDYYDGQQEFLSTSPFDPASLFVEHKLNKPMPIGQAIQVKGAIWPLLSQLIDEGKFEFTTDGSSVLLVEDLLLKVYFNDQYQVERVTWGESQDQTISLARWDYADFGADENLLLPSSMLRIMSINNEERPHEHYTLRFNRDTKIVAQLIELKDEKGNYRRKNARTSNVYEPDGTLAYNEKDMANEYLAALGKGSPKQTRVLLLTAIAVFALGSIVIMRKRMTS